MSHIIITCIFTLLALGGGYFTFRRWQKNKGLWYVLSVAAFVLSSPAFWLSWVLGFLLFVPAGLLLLLGELFKKKINPRTS